MYMNVLHPGDNIKANGTSEEWMLLRMIPESSSIL
jgi:hypothetical protein